MEKYIKYYGGDSCYSCEHIINVAHIVDFSFEDKSISCTPVYGVKREQLGDVEIYKSNNKKDVAFIREMIEDFLLNDEKLLDINF